ncbi:MAG: hypothetical protein ACK5X3_08145 [Pseudomonadota bacterium]
MFLVSDRKQAALCESNQIEEGRFKHKKLYHIRRSKSKPFAEEATLRFRSIREIADAGCRYRHATAPVSPRQRLLRRAPGKVGRVARWMVSLGSKMR